MTASLRHRTIAYSSLSDWASFRSEFASSTTMAPCSRRTQSRVAQTPNCLLMLSRVMPTISLRAIPARRQLSECSLRSRGG